MGKLPGTEHSSKTKCSESEGNIPVFKQIDEVVLAIHNLVSRLELVDLSELFFRGAEDCRMRHLKNAVLEIFLHLLFYCYMK